jgi:pyruvate/2-oxoglutarate dehydrogenase complex dihydrolipoamide dehydrogenase (E3) component
VQNALFLGRKKFSDLVVPWCTYTDPEVAHVGVGPSEARARGVEIDTYRVPLSSNDRARTDGDPDGFVKLHTLRRRDRIVGATIVARHAGEMIGPVALAIAQRIGLARFAGVILPYPTRTEAIKAVSSAYLRTRLTPVAQRILAAWLRLRSR